MTAKGSAIAADAAGKTVAVVSTYVTGQYLLKNSGVNRKFEPRRITEVTTDADAWVMLETGTVDAVYSDTSQADVYLRRLDDKPSQHFYANGEEQLVATLLAGYPFAGWHINQSDTYKWQMPDGGGLPNLFFECGKHTQPVLRACRHMRALH